MPDMGQKVNEPAVSSCRGHISGILLPRRAWAALRRENIWTGAQLADIAPRIERVVPGIGAKLAGLICEQLTRALASGLCQVDGEEGPGPVGGQHPAPMKSSGGAGEVRHTIFPWCGNSNVRMAEGVV